MAYLTAFFNSSIFKFCFRDSFPELQGGTRELSKIFFDKIPVLEVQNEINEKFKAISIDEMLFDLYGLSDSEREAIGFIEIN